MHMNTMDSKSTNSAIPTGPKEKLMDDLRTVAADAEELLRATTSQAGDGVAAARARIQESLKVVKERLISAEKNAIAQTRKAAKATDEFVHESPWKAIAITACAGILVGMLIKRR